jgi:class 3 adenylate cyclase
MRVTVHIASRITNIAKDGQILASESIPEMAAGTDVLFTDEGERSLRDVPGVWKVFSVDEPAPRLASTQLGNCHDRRSSTPPTS